MTYTWDGWGNQSSDSTSKQRLWIKAKLTGIEAARRQAQAAPFSTNFC